MMREMTNKPHHNRQRPFSERNQVPILAGFVVVIVLALLVAFLWWMKNPKLGSPLNKNRRSRRKEALTEFVI
jgi:hypothetical protein